MRAQNDKTQSTRQVMFRSHGNQTQTTTTKHLRLRDDQRRETCKREATVGRLRAASSTGALVAAQQRTLLSGSVFHVARASAPPFKNMRPPCDAELGLVEFSPSAHRRIVPCGTAGLLPALAHVYRVRDFRRNGRSVRGFAKADREL